MREHRPNFEATREDLDIITKVADRAIELEYRLQGTPLRHERGRVTMTWHMDLLAAHNSCPLDLAGLLAAKDGDFGHDVFGIRRHIDRETGIIGDCFLPRFAKRVLA